jgi:hypothetical protein
MKNAKVKIILPGTMTRSFFTRVIPFILLIVTVSVANIDAQTGKAAKKYGKGTISKSGFKKSPPKMKEAKVKEPKAVVKAKRELEKKEKARKKEEAKAVREGKVRHFSIQSDSVKERMRENEKSVVLREKTRKKTIKKASKPAARRYKK